MWDTVHRDSTAYTAGSSSDGSLWEYLHEFTGRAGIRSMDTMNQMGYMVRRMVGKTLTDTRLTA